MISVLGQLQGGIDKVFDWFKKKFLKGNADKCHLITSSKSPVGIEVANMTIMSEEKVKLLGIHIDNRLNFDYHISQLCKKAGKKLHVLTRVFKYLDISQRKLIANAFKTSQLSYCSLIWMFHSQAMEHRINRIHERTRRIIYPNQHQLTFKELQRNLQALATEICQAKTKISPEVVNSLFEFTNKNYNLRNTSILKRNRYFTAHHGSESLVSLALKIWKRVPDSIREVKTLSIFKNKIKAWTTDKCPCRLYKNYIGLVGFI